MNDNFEIKRIGLQGAYNSARYKKAVAEAIKKPLLISYDGSEHNEAQMLEAAKYLCKVLDLRTICLFDQHQDEAVEISYTKDENSSQDDAGCVK